MKTKTWILIFATLALICSILNLLLFYGGEENNTALVYSDGTLVERIDLTQDADYRIDFGKEWNILSVKNGKISVSSASCATQDCVRHGQSNHGAPIVCLPNRLVIEFEDTQLDAFLK
ncbi:MAG: NusG domain II-containing protein [Ruminococcaceae bacterium]|nr:NusG domain II-containing protein [Oscillospiraceae bacterium]